MASDPRDVTSGSPSDLTLRLPEPAPRGDNGPPDFAVILSKTKLVAGDTEILTLPATREERVRDGVGSQYKPVRPGAFIVPLGKAAAEARAKDSAAPGEAVVIADVSMPYRVVYEVLFTLGQSGYGKQHLMVLLPAGGRDASAPAAARPRPAAAPAPLSSAPVRADATKPLDLHVDISEQGVSFRTAEGTLGAACARAAQGVTVPNVGGALDASGVTRCAKRVKREAMSESAVVLTPGAGIDYEVVVAVIDALRGDRDEKLFPDVTFAAPR